MASAVVEAKNSSSRHGVRGRSVNICSAEGDDASTDRILTVQYPLKQRSAMFKRQYRDRIGCNIQSRRPSVSQLGVYAGILSKAVKRLGFERIGEARAEREGVEPDLGKLNLLILTSAKCELHLSGPSYLVIKPFVGRMYFMCTKWFLVQSMRRIEERMRQQKRSFRTASGRIFSHEEFTPFTLNLNNKCLEEILWHQKQISPILASVEQPGAYLAKPARGSMGQRQQLVHIRKDRVHENLLNFLLTSQFQEMRRSQVILQRYVERPLLVDRRKFDMRVYMLVVNAKRVNDGQPLADPTGRHKSGYFVFMHPGFLRLCTAPYDLAQTDLAVHLTNQSVQAKHTNTFSQLKEVTTWYPDELNQYLNRRRRLPMRDWTKDVLYPKVGAILGYISVVFRRHLDDRDCPTNTFRILGVDFLVDEELRVYLLEFNSHPSWGRQTSVLNHLKPNLWREATCLTAEVAARYRCGEPVRQDQLVTRQNFRLVYSSEEPAMARQSVARLFI